jgi:hypothetical protein
MFNGSNWIGAEFQLDLQLDVYYLKPGPTLIFLHFGFLLVTLRRPNLSSPRRLSRNHHSLAEPLDPASIVGCRPTLLAHHYE